MTASIVTFTNQIGAGGSLVARATAAKLRYRYYDWEVISQAAAEAGVSPEVVAVATAERAPSFLERMMKRLAGPEEAPVAASGPRLSILASDDYRQFIEHVVQELASRGDAVIVGHAAQAILRDRASVLRVLIHAGNESRIARVRQLTHSTEEEARKTIEDADKQRSAFFNRVYHIDWLNARTYDLTLSTDRVSIELAKDMIVAAAREVP